MSKEPLVDESLPHDEKLSAYMRLHRELSAERLRVKRKLEPIYQELQEINSKISRAGTAINHLKHGGQTPLVTDHAIVRYLERVEGLDIDDIRVKIGKHSKSVKVDNVIVTVNGDLDI